MLERRKKRRGLVFTGVSRVVTFSLLSNCSRLQHTRIQSYSEVLGSGINAVSAYTYQGKMTDSTEKNMNS